MKTTPDIPISDLRADLNGNVIAPDDPGYDHAPAAYVGFLGDDGEQGVRRAYPPATRERLCEVKRQYDPDNLFRLNLNVPPAVK
jgi:hypothetical protein